MNQLLFRRKLLALLEGFAVHTNKAVDPKVINFLEQVPDDLESITVDLVEQRKYLRIEISFGPVS